jgi:multidrug efflux pump
MNPSEMFIRRPVATTLLTIAIAIAGAIAFTVLPVSPLPQVDFPTISVGASLPGASAEIMASSVATPLERQFGHIAGVSEMTSTSSLGTTGITIQFDLSRNIDGAARDVEAAISAARSYLPANLPGNPTYRKVNPADAPIMIIGLTSAKYDTGKLYDEASTVMSQKLSQIQGVGQVSVGGSSLPSVRVDVNPTQLNSYGLTLAAVQAVISTQNADIAKGQLSDGNITADIIANDQMTRAEQYKPIIIGYHNGTAVRLSDIAEVTDGVSNIRSAGYLNGIPAVMMIIFRQPGANIIQTNQNIHDQLPFLKASIPQGIDTTIVLDRTTTIKASVKDVESTLIISVFLVILVVFVFLRNARATLIPSVAVPVSLIGTFAAMYLFGYSIDNLSLMALTISTGFVVDDAIVVMENISRHLEKGMDPFAAALKGAAEIGFTVFSISVSLIAVFIPILMMGGIVGRLFREFAVTLSTAIVVSMVISLTTTPAMCAYLLKQHSEKGDKAEEHGRLYRASERFFTGMIETYRVSLTWALEHSVLMLIVLGLTIGLNVLLIDRIPKGFFPQQDTGALVGGLQGPQDASFPFMDYSIKQLVGVIRNDPAVDNVIAFTGGQGATNTGFVYISLKPLDERKIGAADIINRLRPKMNRLPVASAFMQAAQDLRIGGRSGNALYQYTIQCDNIQDLSHWGPILLAEMKKLPGLQDVNTDQQNGGLQELLNYDRKTAARVGATAQSLDAALYNAFGQAEVSIIYTQLNQYYVVLEVAPKYWQNPQGLKDIYLRSSGAAAATTSASGGGGGSSSGIVPNGASSSSSVVSTSGLAVSNSSTSSAESNSSSGGGSSSSSSTSVGNVPQRGNVPLTTIASAQSGTTPLAVNHTGLFPSVTVSFNLAPGVSLGDATVLIADLQRKLNTPQTIRGFFAGTAQAYQQSLSTEWMLLLVAVLAVYIVLGVLYESLVHPITIISTLPSASVGAMLALMLFKIDLNVISIIGIVLLIGIVKKNAIMMIDFALVAERQEGKSPADSIFEACMLRFRPILMTTMAALFGALPLAFGTGTGSELRRPLGITIVGGLIVSQMLTLYTTPVVYLFLDRLRLRFQKKPHASFSAPAPEAS